MLTEEASQPANLSLWQSLQKLLFEPHSSLTEPGTRREARLVSILAFLFSFTGLVATISINVTHGPTKSVFVLLGFTVVVFAAYILTRTRLHKTGSYLTAWALAFTALGFGEANGLSYSVYAGLIPAFVLASLTFPFGYMVIFVGINLIAIGLMPVFYPAFTEAGTVLGLAIPFSLLMLAVTRHREQVERDRLKNCEQLNQELTLLRREFEQTLRDQTTKSEEQARQVQVIMEVARMAASFQDLDRLLTSSTRLISESFGFYHAGIFLLDDEAQFAVLRAANSEGGQRMLDRMHTLPVDLNSIVGYTAKTQAPRIALDIGEDSVYFNNPDLPETRSEMALPLKVGMRLIGILDVQSTQKDAFSEEDIALLSTLGDQLAIAIDNTRLLTETRRALVAAEQTYQRYFTQAWSQFAPRLTTHGYEYRDGKLVPLRKGAEHEQVEEHAESRMRIPLMVRGQTIGIVDVRPRNGKQNWDPNEIAVLEAAAERTALALESARLLQDAQRRAAKESIISEISSKISEESAIDKIMSATVSELQRLLDASEVTLRINE